MKEGSAHFKASECIHIWRGFLLGCWDYNKFYNPYFEQEPGEDHNLVRKYLVHDLYKIEIINITVMFCITYGFSLQLKQGLLAFSRALASFG